jgi:pimeloyl-ACP methyl ester carboxylesterase
MYGRQAAFAGRECGWRQVTADPRESDATPALGPIEQRTQPALVLIHGGCHSGSSWDETLSALRAQQPDVHAFAVNLPGRCGVDGDLASLITVGACATSVSGQINKGIGAHHPVVLVGHSMAGVVIPGVVKSLGENRVRRVIFVACCVPPAGMSILDTLPRVVSVLARRVLRKPVIDAVPFLIERFIFGNKASRAQRARIGQSLCPESTALITSKVSDGYDSLRRIPVGWVLPTRDRAMPPRKQRTFMTSLEGFDNLATVDAGHEVLITHANELAKHILKMVNDSEREIAR